MPVFGGKGNREEKKNAVLEKLKAFFNRFASITNGDFGEENTSNVVSLHPVDYLKVLSAEEDTSKAAETEEVIDN